MKLPDIDDFKIPAIILIIFAVTIGFLIYGGDDLLGLTTDDTNTLISLLPGIGVLLVAFFAVSKTRGYMLSAGVAGVGLSLAFLIHLMDEASLLIPDLEMSVSDLQLVIIIFFLIIAAGLAVREQ